MKVVFIFYYAEYDEDIMAILEKINVKSYSKLEQILGKGKTSNPRLNTAVWPGFNNALIVGVKDEEKKEMLLQALRKYSDKHQGKGICVLVLPLEEII